MNPATSVVRCVFPLVVSLAGAAAQTSPTLFPGNDFPFTSWQLPPVNPAETPPKGMPPYFPIKPLLDLAARQRIVSCEEDEKAATLTATLDEYLDLAAELNLSLDLARLPSDRQPPAEDLPKLREAVRSEVTTAMNRDRDMAKSWLQTGFVLMLMALMQALLQRWTARSLRR